MQIKVNGNYYKYFNSVVISTTLDTIASVFSFMAYFDPTNTEHKILFKPLSYYKIEFFHDDGNLIMTGTITHHSFKSSAEPNNLVQVSGYSLPGVLDDCQIPYNLYPLESDNRTLQQIISRLIAPFHFALITYTDVAKVSAQLIAKTVAKVDETIKDYICKVANQKNVVISHDIHGNLVLFQPDLTAAPKLTLTAQNTLDMALDIDGTKLHSHITCLRQPSRGNGANDFDSDGYEPPDANPDAIGQGKVFKISSINTVTNRLIGTYRPKVNRLTKLSFYDTTRAALNMRAAELKNIKVLFSLDRWEKISVGDIIQVLNPDIFINNTAKMVLESTVIQQSAERKTMTGVLVLAETFNGDEPQNIFG